MDTASSQDATGRAAKIAERHSAALMGAVSALVALGLYGRALGLPLYHDDALWLKAIRDMNLVTLFAIKGDRPYYRPAAFAPWLVIHNLAGDLAPLLIHVYTFLLFVACAWLAGLAARRFAPGRPLVAWGTLAIFLFFPFTYQTVTWASVHVHLQPLACVLGAILLLDRWWDQPRLYRLGLAWLLLATAIFTHENGPIMPVLLAGWLLLVRLRGDVKAVRADWRRLTLALAPTFALAVLYVAIWVSLTHSTGNQPHVNTPSIAWNVVYLAQGIAYPVTLLGGSLLGAGIAPVTLALILDAAGILLLGALLWASHDRRLLIVPWWYAASIVPATLFLPSDYIVDAPRMMTTGSFVAALAWATAIALMWERLRGAARLIPAALGAVMLAGGGWFIVSRMAMEDQMGPVYWDLMRSIRPNAPGVVVNLPAWISPQRAVFALGSEGIAYQPGYFPFSDLVWANTGRTPRTRPVFWPEIAPEIPGDVIGFANDSHPQNDDERLRAIHNNDQVLIVRAVNNRLAVEVNRRLDAPLVDPARFSNGFRLAASAAYRPDLRAVAVSLSWDVARPEAITAFVHLTCGGDLAAQADGAPLGGLHPFEQWTPGERWQETRLIAVPAGVETGCLGVNIGLYQPGDGRRVPLVDGRDVLSVDIGGR